MGTRSIMILLLAILLALSAVLVIVLLDWRGPAQQPVQETTVETLATLIDDDNVSAIWYDLRAQRLYGSYGQVSSSVDNLPRNADFYADLTPEEFWELATLLKQQSKGLTTRGNFVVGYVRDPQSLWQRYREYWIFSICLLLAGAVFVLWLRRRWNRQRNNASS